MSESFPPRSTRGGKPNSRGRHQNHKKHSQPSEDEKRLQRAARFAEKPMRSDYGFVSRGEDNRLQQSRHARVTYFRKIMNNFSGYCHVNDKFTLSNELEKYMERTRDGEQGGEQGEQGGQDGEQGGQDAKRITIDSILSSLRKLREAMINIPPDNFMVEVFLFSIRISVLIGHYQTYIPSINHLLSSDIIILLNKLESQELAHLLILHLLHFNNASTKAIEVYFKYFTASDHISLLKLIKSWVAKDYYTWTRIYNMESDNAKATMMRFGIKSMVEHIITAIDKSYYNVEKSYLNEAILPNGIDFDTLVDKYLVKWRLEGSNIVIKDRRVK